MVVHSTLTGDDLHYPLGHSVAGSLELVNNTASAYLIEDASGNNILTIDTTTVAPQVTWGNATTDYTHAFVGPGVVSLEGYLRMSAAESQGYIRFDERSGDPTNTANAIHVYSKDSGGVTHLYARDSGGTVHSLTEGAGASGTTALSFTINSDATNAADENASLILLSSEEDGLSDNLYRATLTFDGLNERLYWTVDQNLNSGGYVRQTPNFGIGTPSSTTSASATLSFYGGDGSSAYTGQGTYSITSSRGYLTFTGARLVSQGSNSNSLVMGASANDTADNATVYGRSGVGANGATAIGGAANATATGSLCINAPGGSFSSATASATGAIAIAAGANVSAGHSNTIVIGSAGTTTASDQVLIRGQSYVFGNGVTSTSPVSATIRLTTGVGASSTNTSGGDFTLIPGIPTGNGNGGDLIVQTAPPGSSGTTLSTAVERFRITDTGEVGIGNVGASPSGSVHVLVSSSSTSVPTLLLDQDGAGDAFLRLDAGSESWCVGIDNSDTDAFKIAETTELGSDELDRFVIEAGGGAFRFNSHATWGDNAANESLKIQTFRQTTADATVTTAWSVVLAERTAITAQAWVTAHDGAAGAVYRVFAGARRFTAGNATLVGATSDAHEEDAAWACTFDCDTGTQTLRLRVTGDGSNATSFTGSVLYQITYL